MNVTLRGLRRSALEMRDGLKIAEGRWFRPGKREVVVGKSMAKRYPDAQLGQEAALRPGRMGSGRRNGRRPKRATTARYSAT